MNRRKATVVSTTVLGLLLPLGLFNNCGRMQSSGDYTVSLSLNGAAGIIKP